jgi:uncharacterized protein
MNTQTLTNPVTMVNEIYEAFGRGDIPFIIDQLSDNCHWVASGEGFLPEGGTYKGRDAANFFTRLNENIEFTAFNPVSINSISEKEVVAFGNMSAISRATGKTSTSDWAMLWKFDEDGKVAYYQNYHDTASAFAATQP